MEQEYEIVAYPQVAQMNVLVVDLSYRAPHLHDDLELGMVLSGSLCLNTKAEEHRLRVGDVYILNPKELHELSTDGGGAYVLAIQIPAERLSASLPWKKGFRYTAAVLREHFEDSPRFWQLLQALVTELAYRYFFDGAQLQRSCHDLLEMLISLLDRYVPTQSLSESQQLIMERSNYRISKVLDYVERNFRSKLLLSDIAQAQGLSMSYLSHFFKDTLHMSFQEYLNKQRFEYACGLLRATDKSLSEISDLSGFSDTRYLVRLCERTYGCTPQVYRHTHSSRSDEHPEGTLQRICPPAECRALLAKVHGQAHEALSNCSIWDLLGGETT